MHNEPEWFWPDLPLALSRLKITAWQYDPITEQIRAADDFLHLLGCSSGKSPRTLTDYLTFVADDDRARVAEAFRAMGRPGASSLNVRHRLYRADAPDPIHVEAVADIRSPGTSPLRIQGFLQDVSDLVRTREQATQLADRLANTLDSMADAFYLLAPDLDFVYLNPQAERLLRRSANELIGQNVWQEFPEAEAMLGPTYRQALRTNQAKSIEFYYPPLQIWFAVDAYPSREGLAVYFRDVSERVHAEEQARLNAERFRLLAKATSDVIWDWDLQQQTVWWNENLAAVLGYPHAEALGRDGWQGLIHADDRLRLRGELEAVISGSERHWESTYRVRHANGSFRRIIDRGYVIRRADGQALRMIGAMTDITEREELSARLRQSQKLEAVGQLTGGVAHDFNNLLTIILGNAELLSEQLSEHQQLRLLAEMTETAAARGAELTARLLAFARRQPLEPRVLDLNRLVVQAESLLRRTLPEDIDIEIIQAGGLWLTEIDAGQLEVALVNLVINARDAISGSGKLTLETANTALDDSYAAEHDEVSAGQYVRLSVTDSGIGMEPQVLEQAFDPFFTTKPVGKGSGLGLSMVYGFVKQSGGHIKLYSEPGQGTTVKLYFPRALTSSQQSRPDVGDVPSPGGNEHILVVEDDPMVRQHVCQQLLSLGYRVSAASHAQEALQQLEQQGDIALLFTDVVMPGDMNGRQLADAARQRRPDLKILYTSGYTENAIIHHGRLDPGVQLLSKPYRRQELASKIRQVLGETGRDVKPT